MRTVRRGALLGSTVVGVVIALAVAVDCASPTQIIIDVHADRSLCEDTDHPLKVGFAVTKVATLDDWHAAPLQDYQDGCKVKADGVVGSMTIKPSDDKNATIGIRVVGAIGEPADVCATDLTQCIVQTRLITFIPGTTVRETVSLTGDCKGAECAPNQDCVQGACVDQSAIHDDGGITPDTGNPTATDAYVPPPKDSGVVETGPGDACAACTWGVPGTATCNGTTGTCTIHCTDTYCTDTVICGNGLNCNILCDNEGACQKTVCGPKTTGCSFDCNGGQAHCKDIACDSGACNVTCQGNPTGLTCDGVTTLGKTNKISCDPTNADAASCDRVTCVSTDSCTRTCGPDGGFGTGCGPTATCDGGSCGAFEFLLPPPPPPPPDGG